MDDNKALRLFEEILSFPTVSNTAPHDGSYDRCAEWLLQTCLDIGLEASVLPSSLPGKPIVIAEWKGEAPSLPCILLNSHYDVVPVVQEQWTVPAFGHRKDNRIYGRGAQDMKCVCVQYLIALDRMRQAGFTPYRTLRLSFVPDEEIGGKDGMGVLLESDWYKSHAVGLALDEGLASEDDDYCVFYGERIPWWIRVTATGNTGHASRLLDNTAIEKLLGVMNKAMEFRKEQKNKLHNSCNHNGCSHSVAAKTTLGDVVSLNITNMQAGIVEGTEIYNVIPSTMHMGMDIRIPPHIPPADIADTLTQWCREAEKEADATTGLTWEYVLKNTNMVHNTTSTDNVWYTAISDVLRNDNIRLRPMIFPAATDSRFLRAVGVPAFGFSPIRNSPILLHENDEYLDASVFLEGCQVYVKLLSLLSSEACKNFA